MPTASTEIDEFLPEGHVEAAFVSLSKSAVRIAGLVGAAPRLHGKVRVLVDRRTLYKVVVSAYYDIVRYKHFHFSADHTKKSDAVKRAAYFTKWIVRFRPLQVLLESEVDDEPDASDPDIVEHWLVTINEHLALQWACGCLADEHGLRGLSLSPKFRHDLLYELLYRDLNSDGLIAIFQMLSDTIRSKKASPLFEIAV